MNLSIKIFSLVLLLALNFKAFAQKDIPLAGDVKNVNDFLSMIHSDLLAYQPGGKAFSSYRIDLKSREEFKTRLTLERLMQFINYVLNAKKNKNKYEESISFYLYAYPITDYVDRSFGFNYHSDYCNGGSDSNQKYYEMLINPEKISRSSELQTVKITLNDYCEPPYMPKKYSQLKSFNGNVLTIEVNFMFEVGRLRIYNMILGNDSITKNYYSSGYPGEKKEIKFECLKSGAPNIIAIKHILRDLE